MESWFPRLFAEIGAEDAAAYSAAFLMHQIMPEDCDVLNHALLAEMGVEKIGHRIRILRAIHNLYQGRSLARSALEANHQIRNDGAG